jgi:DNA-directed RNA polymerase subunit RPC12/RpoP
MKESIDWYICSVCDHEFGVIFNHDIAGGFFESACPTCGSLIGSNYAIIPKYQYRCGTCDNLVSEITDESDITSCTCETC